MYRINALLIALPLLLLFSINTLAEDNLNVSCNIIFDRFNGVENRTINKDVVLADHGRRLGWEAKVATVNEYNFSVRVYSTQEINGNSIINNFQVLIKNKARNLSVAAMSDSVYVIGETPQYARIDLADYNSGDLAESGSLLFECRHLDE